METQEVYRIAQDNADRRRQWLAERVTGIGGSDAAVVLGLSPWKSRYELWAEKSLAIPQDESEPSLHLDLGNNLEAVVLRLLELLAGGAPPPALIVGVPVGFVNAAESKDLLARQDCPYITALGPKGGSALAASIVNALAIMALSEVPS